MNDGVDMAGPLLDLDHAVFRERFNIAPFVIGHRLADHPLFALPRLLELARTLPPRWVEYSAGDMPLYKDPLLTLHTGLSIEDTIKQIETCKSWMVMKRVEQDPEYGRLLDQCLDEIEALSGPLAPGMTLRRGFIFITSPGALTPCHMDPEYNFLLQIHGVKTVHVLDGRDRSIVSETDLEYFLAGGNRNVQFRDGFTEKAESNRIVPGTGVHIPLTSPHWVENGPEVSISFSITFVTPGSYRRECVYALNAKLRRLGLSPSPYGYSRWRDDAKSLAERVLKRVGR